MDHELLFNFSVAGIKIKSDESSEIITRAFNTTIIFIYWSYWSNLCI